MNAFAPIVVSAPGKLFLIGEYAVLEGAPAILAAIDRRARVQVADATDDHWHLTAPNLDIHRLALGADGRPGSDIDPVLGDRLRVYQAVQARVSGSLDTPLPPLDIHIDTTDFARDGHKLGLGSSAAVAAALTCALLARAGIKADRARLVELAIAAHRDAQAGAGSGGDVAAAVYGGLIGYSRDRTPWPLAWPTGLTGMAVITGTGASTTELVGRVADYARRCPDGFAADIGRLSALAETAVRNPGDAARFVHLARDYFAALMALDDHARAGIVSARHDALQAAAARYGAVFKSSGAGGGDVGLLFTTPEVDATALRLEFEAAGAELMALDFGAPGVMLEGQRTRSQPVPLATGMHRLR